MNTLTGLMFVFTLLDVQGAWHGSFMSPLTTTTLNKGDNNKKYNRALFSQQEIQYLEEDPLWTRLSGARSGSFLPVNASSPVIAGPTTSTTTIGHFVRGGAAMFTPPARFNNNILPSFANTTATNVTVIRGKTVYLHCHVLNLGTKTVSWVRHHDIHVLTVGRITFTNDDRFEAMNKPGSDVWMLRIKFPQLRDAGKYECQVSMKPPIARVINLNVVEPQAVIPPGPELYVDHGSPLNITCLIPDSPEPPENIFWYHRDKMVSYDGSRQGVTITTDKGSVTTSILFIPDVTAHDSGIYVCAPQGMREASVRVRVLNGELPQAMQTGSTCRGCVGSYLLLLLVVFYHMVL
ncbi:opioid-binding protein/cell adhesion molecule homolog isoform X2 [Macrobrachium rosenbergii]|uniref:opioid-binding protein/cell adhesion molecule homolog isoform X2 n=1 Tax=Macrobrachium rosenbergii TaxID=79674 RepID=UPI0034D5A317